VSTANPHRAGTKAAERWDRVQARAIEKAARDALKESLRDEGKQLLSAKAPADFGIMRTRAWLKAYRRLRSAVRSQSLPSLQDGVETMRDVCSMSPESCARYIETRGRF
jgi:hypothetical protein